MTKTLRVLLLNKTCVHISAIAVLGLLVYSNTFELPFVYDDDAHIIENPIIKDMRYFWHPSETRGFTGFAQHQSFIRRYVGQFSFALNYKIHGLYVTGYHITNLLIHILNGILIYFLVVLTFRTSVMDGSYLRGYERHIALFSALLFVAHPVQTQAVTYIAQRYASLAAMFYLLSLVSYIKFRLSYKIAPRYIFYGLTFISAILAMKTKENAFTLPIIIALYEWLFFKRPSRRIVFLIPLVLTMLIVPLSLIDLSKPLSQMLAGLGNATKVQTELSRFDYLLTQFRVVVTYIRLLFMPLDQSVYYDYPAYHSFFELPVLSSFGLLVCIFGFGIYLLRFSLKGEAAVRLVAFGIFWFFIVLSVESGIIPLMDVINEHRLYLPSMGALTALASGSFLFTEKLKKAIPITVSILILAILLLSISTYYRNNVWKSEVNLWEDASGKHPHSATVQDHLGTAYFSKGLADKAIKQYTIAIKLQPNFSTAHNHLGFAYNSKGMTDMAIEHYRIAVGLKPRYFEAHFNLGLAYLKKGLPDEASKEFETALKINPNFRQAQMFLEYVSGKKPRGR